MFVANVSLFVYMGYVEWIDRKEWRGQQERMNIKLLKLFGALPLFCGWKIVLRKVNGSQGPREAETFDT
jgi:hypothetical protein